MDARTIVITGASDGIGAAATRDLAAAGEHVVVVGRSPSKTRAVAEALKAPYHVADFADLRQVRRLAGELQAAYPRIDVLANNAGAIMGKRELTTDGFEKTFQVNHLAAFLLTTLLMPTLTTSAAMVLQTSSIAARTASRFDIDDLQNARRYSPERAYGNTKLENILFTKELHRRYHEQGISAAAFHPGLVATNFAGDSTSWWRYAYHTPLRRLTTIAPARGALGLIWLAEGTPGVTWESGIYYDKNKPGRSSPLADDPVLARKLWDRSEALLGLTANQPRG
jgi:NAD(P)-dependent dehydrogenase (short-subunit alcohol dehydrogenase family)